MATSKQPKQPPFPHPPLEVGVPQYPTPNVPDFYTKSGHIILVEKVSVEKGNYKPLPLDGSVVYENRDANKWPSNLYLVAERPTEDGEYAYRYWANDRTLSSQDPWNYGLDYSSDDPAYPIITRTYITRRSNYTAFAKGSVDPIFGGTARVVAQKMQELGDDNPLRSLFIRIDVVYESVPGPNLTGTLVNEYGAFETISKQVVDPTTQPDTSGYFVSDAITPINASKSERQKRTMNALPPAFDAYSITHDLGVIRSNVSYLLRNQTGGTPPPPAITGNVLDVEDSPMAFPWIRRTVKYIQTDTNGNIILPPSRTEFSTITYTFPGIIYDWNTYLQDGKIQTQLSFFENRFPVTLTVAAKNIITYSTTQPDLTNLQFFKVITRPWAKVYFNIPDGTIHPPAPVSLIGTSISKNGISYGINGGQASFPTYYNIGDTILIGGESGRWQGGIYYQRLTYVTEPTSY